MLRCQPIMLEKAIIAIQLLAHLVDAGLPFQFKGGTSLLLRLPEIRRLSIDIDIATPATHERVHECVQAVSQKTPFDHFAHDEGRDAALPPKKHFRFFYNSAINYYRRDHILLDVLFEQDPVPHASPVLIATPFIDCSRDVHVSIPIVESLLGDKLTAFAPSTIGILYHPERKTDIVKQLFDTAVLFDAATDLNIAAQVYETVHAHQCTYRNKTYTQAVTLDDSITAAIELSAFDPKSPNNTENAALLDAGVTSLQNHLVGHPFRRTEAQIAAGKVACVAAWIKRRPIVATINALRFNHERIDELRERNIGEPWASLQRLKKINPEAFHYWWHAWQIAHG